MVKEDAAVSRRNNTCSSSTSAKSSGIDIRAAAKDHFHNRLIGVP